MKDATTMSQSIPDRQFQEQDNLVKDTNVGRDLTFAPVQNIIETQIIQSSLEVVTQRELNKKSPYQGLKRFNFKDRDRFFGRDKLIARLFEAVNLSSLSLVLGASGSGKSSVMRAGLIPELKKSLESQTFYDFIFTPNQDPFDSLYRCLLSEEKDYNFSKAEAEIALEAKADTLTKVISTLKKDQERWLIFVDQFEELFTICDDLDKRKNFISGIVEVAKSGNSSVKIVLAMRSDFLEQFSFYPDLGAIANQNNIHLVTEMYPDELRQVIEQPAAKHGVVFEEGLVKQIIQEVEGQKGYLPLLQYTLNLLWESECQTLGADGHPNIEDRTLNKKSYVALEGVRGALQKRVKKIYSNLNQDEQTTTKQMFLKLVNIVDTDSGSRAVSRRAYRDEFVSESVEKLLKKFIDENLLVSSSEYSSPEEMQASSSKRLKQSATVEIAHEILLSSWDDLKRWLEQEKEAIILKNWLAGETRRWQKIRSEDESKAEDELLKGSRLAQVVEFRKKDAFKNVGGLRAEENEFIDISVAEKARVEREKEEKEQQELNLERTQRELANQLLEKERTKNKFLLALIGATILSFLAGILGWLVWQGQEQERLLQLSIDINNGQLKPETIALLPKLIEKGNEYQTQGNLERAMSSYRDVLTVTNLTQKQIQDDLTANPNKYKNILLSRSGYEDIPVSSDISKYSQEEKRLVQLIRIEKQASNSLTEIIIKYRIPKLEDYLKNKKYGEKIASKKPSEFQSQFTEGALQETYKILIIDLGADINKSGYIGNDQEAERMPKEILVRIENLWRENTNQKCGWFGQKDNLKDPECQSLKGTSLSNLIFYGPTNAQKRLEDAGITSPVSNQCVQKSILDVRESLKDNLSLTTSLPNQMIGKYLKITGGSGKITYSQYSQLIPVGMTINKVTGSYDSYNRQMRLEINGRLLDIYLLQPLNDNQPIKFVITKITRNSDDGESIYRFIPSYITIASEFITEGVLQKKDNYIKGTFKTEGAIWLWEFPSQYKGIVNGEFILNVEPGQKSEIPPDYIQGRILTSVVEKCLKNF
jgi:hypothetical protein